MSVATTSRYDIQTPSPPGGRRTSPRLRQLQRNTMTSLSTQNNNNNNNNNNSSNSRKKKKDGRNSSSTSMMITPPSLLRRRSSRGSSSLWELARFIIEGKNVVFVTGAGLSVASGVRAFRTTNSTNNNNNNKYYSHSNKNNKRQKLIPTAGGGGAAGGASSSSSSSAESGNTSRKTTTSLVEEQPLGIWNSVLWTQAKRETFRKDPLLWWNEFWLRYFPPRDYEDRFDPNAGHLSLASLQRHFPDTIKIITQNVDGLQHAAIDNEEKDEETAIQLKENIIEAHGRLGLYKCLPEEDSDTDSSDDEDDDRPVHLGHRRKYRAWKRRYYSSNSNSGGDGDGDGDDDSSGDTTSTAGTRIARKKHPGAVSTDVSSSSDSDSPTCQYQMLKSLHVDQLVPATAVRNVLKPPNNNKQQQNESSSSSSSSSKIRVGGGGGGHRHQQQKQRLLMKPPRCPSCGNTVLPQALLFDEGYHSHEHYNFTKMEEWLEKAEVLVFVGTSFAVTLPLVALDRAREVGIPVFNFNPTDTLVPDARLNAENIVGPSQETLPKLWQAVQYHLNPS